ncbi:helix-turn-helix transcriptional regulator [Spirillospora sp. NPDC049024]
MTSPALAAFGRQFRRYRERAGLSQARVGHRTGKTASFVSQRSKAGRSGADATSSR